MKHALFFAGLSVFIFATTSFSYIHLSLETEFTVSGLNYSIKQIDFADYDYDGFPEVLANDGSQTVVYHVDNDQVLFTTLTGVLCGASTVGLLFADVVGDSTVDAVISRRACDFPSYTTADIVAYDGGTVFSDSSFASLPWDSMRYVPSGLHKLSLSGQGSRQLMASFGLYMLDQFVPETGWTSRTLFYHLFPDSLCWQDNSIIDDARSLALIGTPERMLVNASYRYTYSADWFPGVPSYSTSETKVEVRDTSGTVIVAVGFTKPGFESSYDYWAHTNNHTVECVGNIYDDGPDVSLVTAYRWSQYYVLTEGLDVVFWDTSGAELMMYQFVGTDSLTQRWAIDITENNYTDFAYHPQHPGIFFGIDNDLNRLVQFDGANGTIIQTSDPLPSGTRFWDALMPDGEPRLVVLNDSTVSIYKLDEATDAPENPIDPTLPQSFEVGIPYPNPFNPILSIPILMNKRSHLEMTVHNIQGQQVASIYDGVVGKGKRCLQWDASGFASGVYFIRSEVDGTTVTRKATLLK